MSADGSSAVHPATSEKFPWGTLGVGSDQEWHPNHTEYILIDAGARAVQVYKIHLVLLSGPTRVDPLQTRFCQLLIMRMKVAAADGASVFIAFNTDALTLSSTGDVALVRPVIFNVVAPDWGEPIEDLLVPNVGSTSDVSSDMAFSVNERIAASTTGSLWSESPRAA